MGEEENRSAQLIRDSLAKQQAERMYRQRIQSAQEVAGSIMDSRVKNPAHVLPDIVQVLLPSVEACSSVTPYESQPIASALLLRAVGGQVESVKGVQVRELDVQIAIELKDEELLEVLDIYENYEPGGDEEPPVLTDDQGEKLAKYNILVGERSWILDTMTDGLSPLCEQEMGLRMRKLNYERKATRVEGELQKLSEEELLEYQEKIGQQSAKLTENERKDFQKYKDKGVANLSYQEATKWEIIQTKLTEGMSDEDRTKMEDMMKRTNYSTLEDIKFFDKSGEIIEDFSNRLASLSEKIEKKMGTLKNVDPSWMRVYKAFNGMVDNINVTDQWRKAWHDLGAGAVGGFTETRWAEFQKMSDLKSLCELPGVGPAMQVAFEVICKIGLNRTKDVPGSSNTLQMKDLTEGQLSSMLIEPVKNYVRNKLGDNTHELYIGFGVEMARMFAENTFVAGWLGVARDATTGGIVFKDDKGNLSSDINSLEYKYAEPAAVGDSSLYVDRMNDYQKLAGTRAKVMKDFAGGYETGLPALLPVLPDNLAQPMISHEQIAKIADGQMSLSEAINSKAENARWGWAYGVFRGAQIYDIASKFIVGLKGFRSAGEEVEFFFKSPSNVGGLAKKIDVALGKTPLEALRLKMNIFMAAMYAVDKDRTGHSSANELKSILPSSLEAREKTLLNFDKDDYQRIFVRNGFLTADQFEFASERARNIPAGEGGVVGKGMIKKMEENRLTNLLVSKTKKRSWRLVENV